MWMIKVGMLFALAAALMLLGYVVARFKRRRSIAFWSGSGVNDALTPVEAALLMSLHPGTLLTLAYEHCKRLEFASLTDTVPPTLRWTGPVPADGPERSFRDAFDAKGQLDFEGIRIFLDDLYETVNQKMRGYSGLQTALYYEKMATELWNQMQAGGSPERAVFPWLLLLDATEIWEQIGDGEEWQEIKAMHRAKEHLRAACYDMKEMSDAAREAREGFFRYRSDLVQDRYWAPPTKLVTRDGYR